MIGKSVSLKWIDFNYGKENPNKIKKKKESSEIWTEWNNSWQTHKATHTLQQSWKEHCCWHGTYNYIAWTEKS